MFNDHVYGRLETTDDWIALRHEMDPGIPDPEANQRVRRSEHLKGVLASFRNVGAVSYVRERVYVDQDFVQAYASFYYRSHRLQSKHCSRVHFFARDVRDLERAAPAERALALEEIGRQDYLGFVVIRPVRHAPVSWALVSATALMELDGPVDERGEVLIRSPYEVHLLGARLEVSGVPVSEQDSRTGSCAQASIWSAARHLHKRYGEPWRSVVDITAAALTFTDADVATQLPHGSTKLSRDSMVRAMKNLGMHPVVYFRDRDAPWYEPAHRIVARYLDSGIPVIVGMEQDSDGCGEQHAVLAVGRQGHRAPPASPPTGASAYDGWTHLLVNDDQSGPYKSLAIDGEHRTGGTAYDWCLEDATFIMATLPEGVYMKPEVAEAVSRSRVSSMIEGRQEFEDFAVTGGAEYSPVDRGAQHLGEEGHEALVRAFDGAGAGLVARTYLTPGWKYAERMIRNNVCVPLKEELARMSLPKHVYVTEFSLPDHVSGADPCMHRISAHVVVDPTAESYDLPPIAHIPGLLIIDDADADYPDSEETVLYAISPDETYFPKVRGRRDFAHCRLDASLRGEIDSPAAVTAVEEGGESIVDARAVAVRDAPAV